MQPNQDVGESQSISAAGDAHRLVRWPILNEDDNDAVLRVLASRQLVNGIETRTLEREWASFVGSRHCIAVSSCTHAIHLALCALGIRPGDEVLVPALTFTGTVSPVIHSGATPVFVDVLPGTYEMDPLDAASKRTSRTKAVIPVHLHGMPCDIERLAGLVPDLPVIEDACQAHGASLRGKGVGTLGTIGCFSLNQVKPLPAGQGGLVVTDSDDLSDRIRTLASHGAGAVIGWSYGITELAAALARSQLIRLEENNRKGRQNAARFANALRGCGELLPMTPNDRVPVWHKFRVLLPPAVKQPEAVAFLRDRGVEVETWPGRVVPDLDGYKDRFAGEHCPVSREVVNRSVIIGSEAYPLAAQPDTIVDEWANAFKGLPGI